MRNIVPSGDLVCSSVWDAIGNRSAWRSDRTGIHRQTEMESGKQQFI